MRTDEKIGYMIGCLQVAKDELAHMSEYLTLTPEDYGDEQAVRKYHAYIERNGVRATKGLYEMHWINGRTTAKRNGVVGNSSTRQDWGM